jgi:hypothetical protein
MQMKIQVIDMFVIAATAVCYQLALCLISSLLSNETPTDPIYGGRYLADEYLANTTKGRGHNDGFLSVIANERNIYGIRNIILDW